MDKKVRRILRRNRIDRRKHRQWQRVIQICAAVVVFCTTYAMILPAITWDKTLICEEQEHTHDESCYELVDGEEVLACNLEEHTHSEECYDAPPAEKPTYYCGKDEHVHDEEECFFANGELKCTLEEHSHNEACLHPQKQEEETPEWRCGLEEHTHVDACYDFGLLVCEKPEHSHGDDCLKEPEKEQEKEQEQTPVYYCGLEVHTHDESCYADGVLTCEKQEHTHVDACREIPEKEKTPTYYCGLEAHTHDEGCYADGVLTCEKQEHSHTDDCTVQKPEEPIYYCGMEAHEHTEQCYDSKGNLICEKLDHIHDAVCLAPGKKRSMLARAVNPNATYQIPDEITDEPMANDWQVASGRYSSDPAKLTSLTKVVVDQDGNELRLRKNLVPTGTENEFYVYMTVEPVFYHDWKEIFKASGMLVNNANNTASYYSVGFSNDENVSDIKTRLGVNSHCSLVVTADHAPLNNQYTTKTGADVYIDTIRLAIDETGQNFMVLDNVDMVFGLPQRSGSSFTIIFSPANSNKSVKLSEISWNKRGDGKRHDGGVLTFPYEAYKNMVDYDKDWFDHILQRSIPTLVTDPMGEHIEFVDVISCSEGTASFNQDTNMLTWNLPGTPIENPSQRAADYEQISENDAFSLTAAYQMVYKIRLRTEDADFVSGGDSLYATSGRGITPANGTTTVHYHPTEKPQDDRTGTFKVPEVRGLLYDVLFRKLDPKKQPVAGAKFVLTKAGDSSFRRELTTTEEAKTYSFTRLQLGTYTLTETPPEDYTGDQLEWTFTLCYTTNPEVLGHNGDDMYYFDPQHYSYENGAWTITNKKDTKVFIFRKTDSNNLPLQGAAFRLFADQELTQELDVGFRQTGDDGIFSPDKFLLDPGEYFLVEIQVPVGFHSMPVGRLVVGEKRESVKLFVDGNWYEAVVQPDEQTMSTRYILDVINDPAVPLPATGGRGMTPVVLVGVLVLLSTWSYGIFLWCRQKGRWSKF